jgi:hypothetical protein
VVSAVVDIVSVVVVVASVVVVAIVSDEVATVEVLQAVSRSVDANKTETSDFFISDTSGQLQQLYELYHLCRNVIIKMNYRK